MKKNMPLQFAVRTFFIAVIVNSIVSAAHILTDTGFSFSDIVYTFIFSLEMSALLFVPVSIVVFILAGFYRKAHREKLYWLIIGSGIAVTVIIYSLFRELFAGYSESPEIFAAIATFSILVSLSSQYPFFMDFNDQKSMAAE